MTEELGPQEACAQPDLAGWWLKNGTTCECERNLLKHLKGSAAEHRVGRAKQTCRALENAGGEQCRRGGRGMQAAACGFAAGSPCREHNTHPCRHTHHSSSLFPFHAVLTPGAQVRKSAVDAVGQLSQLGPALRCCGPGQTKHGRRLTHAAAAAPRAWGSLCWCAASSRPRAQRRCRA